MTRSETRTAGEEALRKTLRLTMDYRFCKGWHRDQVIDAVLDRLFEELPHLANPTTGQEIVATPQDGGVGEHEGVRIVEFVTGGYTEVRIGFNNRSDAAEYSAQITPDFVPVALSAPGSAGPGEHVQHVKSGGWYEVLTRDAQVQTSEPLADYAFVAVYRNVITGATWVRPLSEMDDGRFRPATAHPSATPSPAQEPGTGDTGEQKPEVTRADLDACMAILEKVADEGSYTALEPQERYATLNRALLTIIGLVGAAGPKLQAIERSLVRATPATKAETRGPADREGER